MYCRAVTKLNLTKTVIEEGRFSLLDQAQSAAAGLQVGEFTLKHKPRVFMASWALIPAVTSNVSDPLQLSEILSFGMDKLLSSEESSVHDVNLEKILGPSREGRWVDEDLPTSRRESEEEEEHSSSGHSVFGCFGFPSFPHSQLSRGLPLFTLHACVSSFRSPVLL